MIDTLSEWWERKFFRVVAYLVFAGFSFFVFMVWTFPDHRIKEIASNHLEEAFDYRYDVSITDLGFWRFTGLEMEGIQLAERVSDDGADDGGMPLTVRIERISARLSPIRSVLNRGPAVRFQIDVGGSVIDGTVVQSGTSQRVDISLNEVDLRESTLLASLLGVPLFGVLDGDIELAFEGGQLIDGVVILEGKQLTLGSTVIQSDQIPVFTELELPTTSFGSLDMDMTIEQRDRGSRLNFNRFRSQGRDINTELWGHIDLLPTGGVPRLDLRIQVNQEYVTEHDLGILFNMSEFRDGEYQDWYGFVLAGTFDDVNFQGSTTAAQGPPDTQEEDEEDEADEEEEEE